MAAKPKPRNPRPAGRSVPRRPDPQVRQEAGPEIAANRVAVATAPALAVLARMPKLLLPALIAVGVVAGLVMGGIAGLLCVLAVVGVLGWLLAAFWPLIPAGGRVVRVGALAALTVIGILQV